MLIKLCTRGSNRHNQLFFHSDSDSTLSIGFRGALSIFTGLDPPGDLGV